MSVEMSSARAPSDEATRLAALRQAGMLESGSDLRLDAIVHRAAMLFNVPMAAISLRDDTRQVFRASIGLGLTYTQSDLGFCGHAVHAAEPFVALNAKLDPRFSDIPLVQARPGIRFYAGAAVLGAGRQPLGALCVMDRRERVAVEPDELAALTALAAEASAIFSNPPMEFKSERSW